MDDIKYTDSFGMEKQIEIAVLENGDILFVESDSRRVFRARWPHEVASEIQYRLFNATLGDT